MLIQLILAERFGFDQKLLVTLMDSVITSTQQFLVASSSYPSVFLDSSPALVNTPSKNVLAVV